MLSLALSPLWLAAARRLEPVAARRIQTFAEFIDTAYGADFTRLTTFGARIVPPMRRAAAWRPGARAVPSDAGTLARISEQVRDAARPEQRVEILPPMREADADDDDDGPVGPAGGRTDA